MNAQTNDAELAQTKQETSRSDRDVTRTTAGQTRTDRDADGYAAGAHSSPENPGTAENASPNRARASMAPNGTSSLGVQDVARIQQFLEDHAQIARQLEANPTLATDQKYLEKHKDIAKQLRKDPVSGSDAAYLGHRKDLRRFFGEHAQIQVEYDHDPQRFMQREGDFERDQ